MSRLTDRTYLLGQQYKDPDKLQARIHLHARFSTNPTGWHRWVFQQLDLSASCTILEVGCGPGHLWRENRDRIPPTWQILLTDFSTGMAATAASHLKSLAQIQPAVHDVQALALPDETFDAVVANHMLYHIPDRERALAEIWRVLKPGGRFFAATNGPRHLLELREFVRSVDFEEGAVQQRRDAWVQVVENFSLENGLEVLSHRFSAVELRRYDDSLVITEVDPIVAFVESSTILQVQPGTLGAFKRVLEAEMAASGAIHITKDSGLFSAYKP
jgi:ubiquinone/menaquinone biosynthesis C-methylase UbiE